MATTTATDLLRLTQWLSPAFPLSGYAYSHGLETAMAEGRVTDAADVEAWVRHVLHHGAGPLDVWAIRVVMDGADAAEVSDLLAARAGCAERWQELRDPGAAFGDVTEGMGQGALGTHPLPVALALRARGMDAGTVALLYLQSFAGQLVSAATRFLPLGQTEAQRTLANLHPDLTEIAARTDADPPGSFALVSDLDAMDHETLQPRIFRT